MFISATRFNSCIATYNADIYVDTVQISGVKINEHRESDADLEFEKYIDGLLGRAIEGHHTQRRSAKQFRHEDYDAVATRMPRRDDFPLWRVECRVSRHSRVVHSTALKSMHLFNTNSQIGTEDTALMYLHKKAGEDHPIRSAFSRGAIKGYIYVEARMDKSIVNLLKRTPGVTTTMNQGLQIKFIEASKYTKLLTMKMFNAKGERGSWVRVTKGLYAGDEGIVEGVDDWGVMLLLVPRMDTGSSGSRGKRKASAEVPVPQLFDTEDEERVGGLTVHKSGEDIYEIGEVRFEKGLIVKAFDMSSVKADATTMSLHLFHEFRRSRHSILKDVQLLKPSESTLVEHDSNNTGNNNQKETEVSV